MMSPLELIRLDFAQSRVALPGNGRLRLRVSFAVTRGLSFEDRLEALTKKIQQLGRGLKFQLLARVNLLYGAFKMSIAWARFPCQSNYECASHDEELTSTQKRKCDFQVTF